jgi:hypothetical protein
LIEQVFDTRAMDVHVDHEIEQLRRSIAMLPPGHQALDRETTLQVLARLQVVSKRVERLEGGLRSLLEDDANQSVATRRHPSAWAT